MEQDNNPQPSQESHSAPAYQNRVQLVGFLGDKPEYNNDRVTFSLATKTSWKAEGKWEERTEWHRLVAWSKVAHAVKDLQKGAYLLIEGELRYREYEREVETELDLPPEISTRDNLESPLMRKGFSDEEDETQ